MVKSIFSIPSIPWKSYVTVEPAFILFCFSFYLMDLVNINLYLQKSCRFNVTVEPDMRTTCDDEKAGINFITSVNLKYRFTVKVTHTIVSVFICAWSDRNGNRKLFLILPTVALILQLSALCYQTFYWSIPADVSVWTEVFFQVLIGGNSMFNTFAKINIFETSNEENRTLRTTILIAIQTMSIPVSSAVSGYMMLNLGFFYTYVCCLILSVASLILTCLFVQNTVTKPQVADNKDFNLFSVIPSSFKIVFQKRSCRESFSIMLLFLISTCTGFATTGERSIIYFFFRYKFHWNEIDYGYYLSYKLIGSICGTLFCSIILSKKLKLHDGLIGAMSTFFLTLSAFGYIFARTKWELYLVPLLEVFNGVALTICDSFLSKFFTNEEFGRLFSVHMIFDVIATTGIPVYSIIFEKTMDKFAATFFLLSMPANFVSTILYSFTYLLNKRLPEDEEEEIEKKAKQIINIT